MVLTFKDINKVGSLQLYTYGMSCPILLFLKKCKITSYEVLKVTNIYKVHNKQFIPILL